MSPSLGRWIEIDPILFAGGDTNLYRNVGNSPTNATDPSGLTSYWPWFNSYIDEPSPGRPGWRHLYIRTAGLFGMNAEVRYIGQWNPTTGDVERGNRRANRATIESMGYEANWDAWFEENGSEICPSAVALPRNVTQGVDRYRALDPNFDQRGPQARGLVIAMGVTVVVEIGLPHLARVTSRAIGELAQRAVRAAVLRSEAALGRAFQEGSLQAARAAARREQEILPGLFRYNPTPACRIEGYQQHHLWPQAMGGPREGWIVYARGVVGNSHVETGAIQNRLNEYLTRQLNMGIYDIAERARGDPDWILPHLRAFYNLEGIPFPY